MRSSVILLIGLLASACARNASTVPAPSTVNDRPVVPVMDTIVRRDEALAEHCRVRRALDGRVVCAATPEAIPGAQDQRPSARAAVNAISEESVRRPLIPGQYVVIGSFSRLKNATAWVRFNADFDPEIQRVPGREPALYRVVIGPLDRDEPDLMQAILNGVGVVDTWQLAACPYYRAETAEQCGAVQSAPTVADANPL